jgi:hypothetical protein
MGFSTNGGLYKKLGSPVSEKHIQTDTVEIENVVEWIAKQASIALLSVKRGRIRRFLDRKMISLKEVSLFKH